MGIYILLEIHQTILKSCAFDCSYTYFLKKKGGVDNREEPRNFLKEKKSEETSASERELEM